MISLAYYSSPFGKLGIVASPKGISRIFFGEAKKGPIEEKETPLHREALKQLTQYFNGQRHSFSLPLDLQGTDFQQRTWQALVDIPYGTVATYKEVAQRIGSPKAFRAVGNANNRNPLPILVPCHRVVGSSGQLVGYYYGLDMKRALLHLEEKNKDKNTSSP